MNKIDSYNLYGFNKSDKVFIDANIIVYMFSPSYVTSPIHTLTKYSNIFSDLIKNNNQLYINSLVVSEFFNLCLRIDFNKNFNDGTKEFKKDYRGSNEYKKALTSIKREFNKLIKLPNLNLIDDDFSKINIISLYNKYPNSDFNDLIIYKNCIDNNLKILTNDKDFQNFDEVIVI